MSNIYNTIISRSSLSNLEFPNLVILDVTIDRLDSTQPCSFQHLLITNYYVHKINILQSINGKLTSILKQDYVLMPDSRLLDGAESIFRLDNAIFKYPLNTSMSFKMYLKQPSAMWLKFDIRDIKVVTNNLHSVHTTESKSISTQIPISPIVYSFQEDLLTIRKAIDKPMDRTQLDNVATDSNENTSNKTAGKKKEKKAKKVNSNILKVTAVTEAIEKVIDRELTLP